jgi:hypothetical protein
VRSFTVFTHPATRFPLLCSRHNTRAFYPCGGISCTCTFTLIPRPVYVSLSRRGTCPSTRKSHSRHSASQIFSDLFFIFLYFHFSACAEEPFFPEPIPNVTVTVGRDATLPCVVENLGHYRVSDIWCEISTRNFCSFFLRQRKLSTFQLPIQMC